jgi:hypothetical protein
MAQIQIQIPDAVLPRVLDAFAAVYGWKADSGQTKAQFARAQLVALIRYVVATHEANAAAETARRAALNTAETDTAGVT